MRPLHRVVRAALPPVVALGVVTAASGTASAQEIVSDRGLAVIANGDLEIKVFGDRFEFCARGSLDPSSRITGEWALSITGLRGDEEYASPAWTSTALSIYVCETVYKNGAAEGTLVADFSYTGVGSYVFARSIGTAHWDPTLGDQTFGVDLSP